VRGAVVNRSSPSSLLLIHIAFLISCIIYVAVGWILSSGQNLPRPVIPPGAAMLALLPGVGMALIGIAFFRKVTANQGEAVMNHIIGCALVEGLAINGLIVSVLSGGEMAPLWTGAGLAFFVMVLNFPRPLDSSPQQYE